MHHVTQICQAAWEAYEFLQKEAMVFEDLLQVSHWWTPDMTELHDAMKYVQIGDYQLAVDKLEALVVQQLFELAKGNLSGTGESVPCPAHSRLMVFLDLGYKLHMHISKALQTRCAAIKTALK